MLQTVDGGIIPTTALTARQQEHSRQHHSFTMPPKQQKQAAKGNPQNQANKTVPNAKVASHDTAKPLTDYDEIQRDEVEVIQSMYMDEFEHVEMAAGAWTAKAVHAFNLHLKSRDDPEIGVTLKVEFPSPYPKMEPTIEVCNLLGLRADSKKAIISIIKKTVAENLGNEMILQIVDAILDYLDERAAAKGLDANKPSLIEERALKERAQKILKAEEDAKLEKEKEADRQKKAEAERQQTRKYLNQAQASLRRRPVFESPSDDEESSEPVQDHCRIFPNKIIVKDEAGRPGKFRKVGGMVLLLKKGNTSLYTVRPIFEVGQDFEVALVLKEMIWTNPDTNSTNGSQLLNNLENDLEKLMPSQSNQRHNIVVDVYAWNVQDLPIDPLSDSDSQSFRIDILMEYASRGSLQDMLESVGKLSVSIVRSWTLQLLDGLRELHQAGIVHRCIHPKNILLFKPPEGGNTIIKFSDPGISHRIHLLRNYQDGIEDEARNLTSAWIASELSSSKHPTKKTDIWDLGVLVLQMLFGLDITDKHPSPSSVLNKERMPSALKAFLHNMFIQEHNERLTAFDLLPMEFLRQGGSVYDDAISDSETVPTHMSPMKRRRGSGPSVQVSRYVLEWDEIQRLGRGGFGEVVKARNKYDGHVYAIKKVLEKPSNKIDDVLKEVLLLSQLNHPNIVRYYSTWMDETDRSGIEIDDVSDSEEDEEEFSIRDRRTSDLFDETRDEMDYISSKMMGVEFGYDSDRVDDENAIESDTESDDESDTSEEEDSEQINGKRKPLKHDESRSGDMYEEDSDSESFAFRETNRMDTGFKPDEIDSNSESGHRLSKIPSKRTPRILYIQMEYCDKQTLRDAIERNLYLNPGEYWQLLSQILEGLDYIHKKGIIHRDLKPENIFLSQTNIPRIGDFGLAANVGLNRPKSAHNMAAVRIEEGGESSNLTTGVGTRLYVAPEVLRQANYSIKVDMYSLGIIFFEMFTKPVKTSTEHFEVITGLRNDSIKLPNDLNIELKEREIGVIRRLLNKKPSDRPDAADLLSDHSIPLANTDKDFTKVLQSLDDPGQGETRKAIVLRKFFAEQPKPSNDPFFDSKHAKTGVTVEQFVVDMQVKERLIAVFKRHGAVEVTKNFLVPDSEYYKERDALKLMNEKGALVQLRYDQVLPHARLLAIQEQTYPKSYSFGIVFRENSIDRCGQPNSYGEVVFDIISQYERDFELKEAETIKVVDEIIDSFAFFQGATMGFSINHSDILNLVLDFCNIRQGDRQALFKELSKLRATEHKWEAIARDLKSAKANISAASLAELKRFDWKDDFEKGFKTFKKIVSNYKSFSSCFKAFDHLRNVFEYLKGFKVKRKTHFAPLGIYNEQYYQGGLMFTCSSESVSSRQVLASGGRYDELIKASRPISTPKDIGRVHAVGFKLSFDALSRAILNHQSDLVKRTKKSQKAAIEKQTISTRRCDVVITASSDEIFKVHGIELAALLWSKDIRAEPGPKPATPTGRSLYTDKQYGWQVFIKGNYATQKTVKLKNLTTGEETDQHVDSLSKHIKQELGPSWAKEVAVSSMGRRLSSTQDMLPSMRHAAAAAVEDASVFLIWPADKKGSKKPNRPQVLENAQRRVSEFTGGKITFPILAMDVNADVLEIIRLTQLQGPEAWKKVIQAANNASEKQYFQEIQHKVFELRDRGLSGSHGHGMGHCCYIYSYRGDSCIFYYLS